MDKPYNIYTVHHLSDMAPTNSEPTPTPELSEEDKARLAALNPGHFMLKLAADKPAFIIDRESLQLVPTEADLHIVDTSKVNEQ